MGAICRWIDRINNATGVIAAWLVVPLIGAMCYEVAARYVFNAPTIWAYELAYLLTGSGWLLGMAYALSKGAHIRVDIVYIRLSPRTQALIDLAGYAVLLLPFVLWVTSTLDDRVIAAFRSGEKSGQSAWNPPIWPFRAVFFVSFALLALQIIGEMSRKLPILLGRAKTD
ncbi:MAG: TRAP transporter small permease subunit [Alphaproteobacteria bacterium]|nr:TRAP transporter small permease subunit [Alphaproteobacteria bacterium]